jgi:predicted transcriptional regulator
MVISNQDNRLLSLTVQILSAHVSHNMVRPVDLPVALESIYRVLQAMERRHKGTEGPPKPSAQAVAQSITADFLVSFEDGKPYKTLRRHLAMHGLTPDEYRAKWGLGADYPMTAPSYSERRSELARALGLGIRHRIPKTLPTGPAKPRLVRSSAS